MNSSLSVGAAGRWADHADRHRARAERDRPRAPRQLHLPERFYPAGMPTPLTQATVADARLPSSFTGPAVRASTRNVVAARADLQPQLPVRIEPNRNSASIDSGTVPVDEHIAEVDLTRIASGANPNPSLDPQRHRIFDLALHLSSSSDRTRSACPSAAISCRTHRASGE